VTLAIRRVGPEAAEVVLEVIMAAFSGRPALQPPADALAETVESLRRALAAGGGLVAEIDHVAVATLLFDPQPDGKTVFLRRFGVLPDRQHHGLAHALVAAAVEAVGAVGEVDELAVVAREELPQTVGFWESAGFAEVGRHRPYVELRRPLVVSMEVPDAEAMRTVGVRLAAVLRAGDVVVLAGGLGAGKTTLTQGLGDGLGVRGQITSPTFVIARVHPSLGTGPDLVHVDAYRLGGIAELDDLDLDTDVDHAVTVVEWGAGLVEPLSDSRLLVTIDRGVGDLCGGTPDPGVEGLDPRVVRVRPFGPRWRDLDLKTLTASRR
jgi:tRNA threonylcarbamoyladenosine biosynthesis protein TsaE